MLVTQTTAVAETCQVPEASWCKLPMPQSKYIPCHFDILPVLLLSVILCGCSSSSVALSFSLSSGLSLSLPGLGSAAALSRFLSLLKAFYCLSVSLAHSCWRALVRELHPRPPGISCTRSFSKRRHLSSPVHIAARPNQ